MAARMSGPRSEPLVLSTQVSSIVVCTGNYYMTEVGMLIEQGRALDVLLSNPCPGRAIQSCRQHSYRSTYQS